MNNPEYINEIFWLRFLACIAVTLGHSIGNGFHFYNESSISHTVLYILNMAVLYGVPVFVFISEFLLSNKYNEKVPKGFMKKRVKILLIPYLVMSVIYALLSVESWTLQDVINRLAMSIFLGDSAVYFVLIIFQFYILHLLLRNYLSKSSPKFVIPIAFIVNFLYLAFFNFVEPPENAVGFFIWTKGYWIPFSGWIFYFVLGYYCGRNYQFVLSIIRKKWWVPGLPIISLGIMLLMNGTFQLSYNSKRIDMLLYASSIIFLILYVSSYIKKVPKFVMMINRYSFNIFLLNLFYLHLFRNIEPLAFLNIITYTILVFLITILLCIGTAYLFNLFNFGRYIVGRIMEFKIEDTKVRETKIQYTSTLKETQ